MGSLALATSGSALQLSVVAVLLRATTVVTLGGSAAEGPISLCW